MKTFDYAAAWYRVAKPAYESLPQNVRDLLARVATECTETHQLPDCSMPWPDPAVSDLRAAFDKVPAEYLALGSRVIYSVGHWYPRSGSLDLPGRQHGAHWKFSHYADQSLRDRLSLGTGDYPGLTCRVHEGAIRLCYQSRDMWTWIEVAPATANGLAYTNKLRNDIASTLPAEGKTSAARDKRDSAAYRAFEALRDDHAGFKDTGSVCWEPLTDTARFMVEEGDQEPEPGDSERAQLQASKAREDVVQSTARKIRDLETERDGILWFMDRGIPTENLIYYSHTGIFTFGWRQPVGPALLSRILDVISEFGRPYAIKTLDGRRLEGNIE